MPRVASKKRRANWSSKHRRSTNRGLWGLFRDNGKENGNYDDASLYMGPWFGDRNSPPLSPEHLYSLSCSESMALTGGWTMPVLNYMETKLWQKREEYQHCT